MPFNNSNTSPSPSLESMCVFDHDVHNEQPPQSTGTVGNVVLQHRTRDLAYRDLLTDPINTPHVTLGRELLLESATYGVISLIVTPNIEHTIRGTPTIFVRVRSEGPMGHGLNDLRAFWATVADEAAAAYTAILSTAIERAIHVTATSREGDEGEPVLAVD